MTDNVDYANKYQYWDGQTGQNIWAGFFMSYNFNYRGVFGVGDVVGGAVLTTEGNVGGRNLKISFSYGNSNNETRVKSKFFSLMIYAGYPA